MITHVIKYSRKCEALQINSKCLNASIVKRQRMNETEVCIISTYINYNYVKNLISCDCVYTL